MATNNSLIISLISVVISLSSTVYTFYEINTKETLKIIVIDNDKNSVKNATVEFQLNNEHYTAITNNEGLANVRVPQVALETSGQIHVKALGYKPYIIEYEKI